MRRSKRSRGSYASLEHRQHHFAYAILAEAGVRDTDDAEQDDQQQPHEDDCARDHDAKAACHVMLKRLADCEAERELASQAAQGGRLVRRRTTIRRHILRNRYHALGIRRTKMSRQSVERAHAQ
jgi:hypothetical protein